MFRTIGDRPSEWELLLPAEVLRLPVELARVDALLDDPAFFAPFVPYFHPVIGRPSTPAECYLRLMFLKFRYRLGFESLCAEVADSISWRRFCRIPLDGKVPHPTTLMKLTTRCGEDVVAGLNEALWAKAAGAKLLRTARVRADTTVIPRECGLSGRFGAAGQGGRQAGADGAASAGGGRAPCTVMTDRRQAAARRVREIASKLRTRGKLSREESTQAIRRVTGELAGLAEMAAAEAAAVLRNGRRALPKTLSGRMRGQLRRALDELAVTIERTATIVAQTRTRLAGQVPHSATRLVSLHDPDARPIRKGRIDKPVEFGYKARVADNDDGIVLDYSVEYGAAAPHLTPNATPAAVRHQVLADHHTACSQAGTVLPGQAAYMRTSALSRQQVITTHLEQGLDDPANASCTASTTRATNPGAPARPGHDAGRRQRGIARGSTWTDPRSKASLTTPP